MDVPLAPLPLQGIHILNYIDDRLIDIGMSSSLILYLLITKKSVLSLAQKTTCLGVVWDLVTMQAQLSPACVDRSHLKHPEQYEARSGNYISKKFRYYGSSIPSDTHGHVAHVTVLVVAQIQGISSEKEGQSPEANKDKGTC